MSHAEGALRRVIDIAGAAVGLLLLSPLFLIVAIAIKRDDAGPIFYRASRIGRGGQPFDLLKFRTMFVDADRRGPGITLHDDARITPIGRWLRRTKVDELPQLWNVLCGEMSLIGPRPEAPQYVAHYTAEQRHVLTVKPGITSVASLAYRHEAQWLVGPDWEEIYLREIMPAKLALDLEYLAHRTLWSDMLLVTQTVLRLCWEALAGTGRVSTSRTSTPRLNK